ncbi:unnamed protein product [Clonostachys rhizophaga]|uniref:CBM21 domain-containing protein n=1 Tax=Clonostachys rhizophaga TaxID=160324 RepID=A0A9N9YWK4_9HYPO|nr:unnamed protein product [Clonostachys rhizophaga]
MPYTPPLNRSPASSASNSPDASRRSSLVSGARPSLPRSASYLRKHRRNPSVTIPSDASFGSLTPRGTSEDLPAMVASANSSAGGASVRQSPPPVSDEHGMPKGAVISPPDSASSGSDDDSTPEIRGRKHTRLVGLRDAVNELALATNSHQPSALPRSHHSEDHHNQLLAEHHAHNGSMHVSFSTSSLPDAHRRRSGHVRSATEPNVLVTKSADNSITASEEETDEELKYKPQMVRKKSGELVRPALRPSSRRRPSSMPGTPVFSKAVHFDSHLEHVRHFLQVDRPLAVSAGSSPVDNHESETEFPFPGGSKGSAIKGPPFEWEIVTPNFPSDTILRKALPAKLEKVWLSSDHKSLLGSIAVANLAFQKHVICRFTLDYWKTTSEVTAEYDQEIRPGQNSVSQDRFTFSIKLSDTINLESKTMFLCVRYSVNGQEYWDNNNSANFQVDFRKKYLPQNGKDGARGKGNGALPRSNRRRNTHDGRPVARPSSFSEFNNEGGLNYDQPIHEVLGESGPGLRFKSKSSSNIASDNIAKGLSSPSGAAFSNRYDFGASLTAAVQASKDTGKEKDTLYMKNNVRPSKSSNAPSTIKSGTSASVSRSQPKPAANVVAPAAGLPSSSYEELVNKYCFFGSKQQAQSPQEKPPKDRVLKNNQFDGTNGGDVPSARGTKTTAVHHSLHTYSAGRPPITATLSDSFLIPKATETRPAATTLTHLAVPVVTGPSFYGEPATGPDRFHWRGDSHTTPTIRG